MAFVAPLLGVAQAAAWAGRSAFPSSALIILPAGGLGALIAGHLSDHSRKHPLLHLGALQGLFGVLALASFIPASTARIFTIALIAMVSALVGASLSLVGRRVDATENPAGKLSALAALALCGAFIGLVAMELFLAPKAGYDRTLQFASIIHFLFAATSFRISRRVGLIDAHDDPPSLLAPGRSSFFMFFTLALSIGILLPHQWTILHFIIGSHVYSMTLGVGAILLGAALGMWLTRRVADAVPTSLWPAGWIFGLLSAMAVLTPLAMNPLPRLFIRLATLSQSSTFTILTAQTVMAVLTLLPPCLVAGFAVPFLIRHYYSSPRPPASSAGHLIFAAGAAIPLGMILAGAAAWPLGLKILPWLSGGVLGFFGAFVGALIIAKVPFSRAGAPLFMMALGVLCGFLRPSLDPTLFFRSTGYFNLATPLKTDLSDVDVFEARATAVQYSWIRNGSSIQILENQYGEHALVVDGKSLMSTDYLSLHSMKLLGHLPILLNSDARNILFVGAENSIAADAANLHPGLDKITLLVTPESIKDAMAPWVAALKSDRVISADNLLDRVAVRYDDPRDFIASSVESYDAIVASDLHPGMAIDPGAYSIERLMLFSGKLRPAGVCVMRVPLSQLSASDFSIIIRTFIKAFPNTMLACLGSDAALVGFKSAPSVNLEKMGRQFLNDRLKKELMALGAVGPADVVGWLIADPAVIRALASEAPGFQSLNRPILGVSAPLTFHNQGYAAASPLMLMGFKLTNEESMARQLRSYCQQDFEKEFVQQAYDSRKSREWLIRGLLARTFGNVDRFLSCMEIAFGARSTDLFVMNCLAEAQTRMGNILLNSGQPKEALEQFNLAMGNDPAQIDAVVGAVRAYLAQRDILPAQQLLDSTLLKRPDVFQLMELKAKVVAELGLSPKTQCEQAMKNGQASPQSLLILAAALLHERNADDAVPAMREAARISPSPAHALVEILQICLENDQPELAKLFAPMLIESATRSIRLDPTNPDFYSFRARAYDALGEEDKRDRDQRAAAALSW